MVKREPMMILTSGNSNSGFTLIEVLIALMIIGIAFTALLELLTQGGRNLARAREDFDRMVYLDKKIKLGDHEGIVVNRSPVPDFPEIKEAVYSYNGVFFIRYEKK